MTGKRGVLSAKASLATPAVVQSPGWGKRVRKAMLALVGEGVRVERAAEQADADYVPLGAVAVLAVVEERDAVAWLGEVTEAVGRDSKRVASQVVL